MKKIYIAISLILISTGIVTAQQPTTTSASELAPGINVTPQNPTPQTPWQLLFSYDITAAGAGTGNAGVVVWGNEIWVSRWGSDTVSNFTLAGTLISQFTISGLTGIRSMTTDGIVIYAGNTTSDIFKIDPINKILIGSITTTGVPNVRYCTYEATLPGFWVGSWATQFTLVDMNGIPTNTVASSSHLLTQTYGLAIDNVTLGGPYLWAFHQSGQTNNADLIQVNIATGMQTTIMHNVTYDIGTPGNLAGGIHIVQTPLSLVGVLQGATTNLLFSYDLVGVNSVIEPNVAINFIAAYPNPANDRVNIKVNRTTTDVMLMQIIDVTGRVVFESNTVGINNLISIAAYEAGVYVVKVTSNEQVYTTQLVKN